MPDEEHLAERRQEILTAAERIFDAHGYAATTVEAVAAEAGISKGSIYNYFRSKRDLFTQVFSAALAGDEADFDRVATSPTTAAEKLNWVVDNWAGRMEHHKRIGGLVLEFWATAARQEQEGELAGWFEQQYTHWRQKIAAIIAQGLEAGEFDRDLQPEVAASLIMAMLDGIIVQSILDMRVHVDDAFLEAIKRAILTSLAGGVKP